VRDDAELDLITVRQWKGRDSAGPISQFIDDLETAAARYDLVLVDLPTPDSTSLAPALLRAGTEVLAVVPQGSAERDLEQVRRSSQLFATPLAGYVFTRGR
jgi:Mrp family chromosome partitioning ATPase